MRPTTRRADSAGSTICRSLMSSVACPLSLARIAASKRARIEPGDASGFQRQRSASGQRAGQRRCAAALARQRHLH